jgi:chloramphenicol O-acetyltransferase
MTKEEKQENLFTKEMESWSNFEYSLREEDRILFSKMLNECEKEEYSKSFDARGEYNSTTESLFMALIFQQQKTISKLVDRLLRYKANQKRNLDNLNII